MEDNRDDNDKTSVSQDIFLTIGQRGRAFTNWLLGHIYPVVIFLASLLVLIFVPMIGSNASIESIIPTDPTQAFLF